VTVSGRERRLLRLLAAVAAVAALRLLWIAAAPSAAARDRADGATPGRAAARASEALPDRLELLRSDRLDARPAPFEVGRDLFRYGPPPAPPGPSAEELASSRQASEEARPAAAASPAAALPRPPEIRLRFLGSFGPAEAKIAVFVAPGEEGVLNAVEGDVLAGKFRVERVGYESVDLAFVEFPGEPLRRLAIDATAAPADAGSRRRSRRAAQAPAEDGG